MNKRNSTKNVPSHLMKKFNLILASASPRRKDLLKTLGIPFEIKVSDTDETRLQGESPRDYVKRLALQKAQNVSQLLNPVLPTYILGADTTVALGDEIFGKPENEACARDILTKISGTTHEVLTGYAIIGFPSEIKALGVVSSFVSFRKLKPDEIESYIETKEPFDKAGAYAMQGKAKNFVEKIEGSLHNIVGLPVEELKMEFARLGLI